jgi:glycosyltransferase involved in cell wall biosynthesis
MTVAIISHDIVESDGQGRVNYELARHLLAEGIAVELIADTVAPELLENGATWLPVHPNIDAVNLIRVWRFKRMTDRLLDDVAQRYDVILACGVVLSRRHTVNVAHFVHGTWLHSPFHASKVLNGPRAWYHWLFSRLNARWEKQAFARAHTVVAVSDLIRQRLLNVGIPASKIEVIGNGVDLDEFAPGPAEREALDLPEGVPLGLFVGDLRSPIKNLEAVLRGIKETPSVHVAVAGSLKGSPYPALAERLGVSARVHFLGFCDEVAELMRAADFLVLPSRQDAFSLVVLEALACGLPVITARTVGASALLQRGGGYVMDGPDDMDTLVGAMQALAGSAERRERMGRAARVVAEEHSWAKMAERYLDVFEDHVGGAEQRTRENSRPQAA